MAVSAFLSTNIAHNHYDPHKQDMDAALENQAASLLHPCWPYCPDSPLMNFFFAFFE
jgi:hypothetical protein